MNHLQPHCFLTLIVNLTATRWVQPSLQFTFLLIIMCIFYMKSSHYHNNKRFIWEKKRIARCLLPLPQMYIQSGKRLLKGNGFLLKALASHAHMIKAARKFQLARFSINHIFDEKFCNWSHPSRSALLYQIWSHFLYTVARADMLSLWNLKKSLVTRTYC